MKGWMIALITALPTYFSAATPCAHAQVPAPRATTAPAAANPTTPRDAIAVPVIPDKIAVPAPTIGDAIKQASPPAQAPRTAGEHDGNVPEAERRDVTPGAAVESR